MIKSWLQSCHVAGFMASTSPLHVLIPGLWHANLQVYILMSNVPMHAYLYISVWYNIKSIGFFILHQGVLKLTEYIQYYIQVHCTSPIDFYIKYYMVSSIFNIYSCIQFCMIICIQISIQPQISTHHEGQKLLRAQPQISTPPPLQCLTVGH